MTERYTETIYTLMGSLHLSGAFCSYILDVIPQLVKARVKSGLTAPPQGAIIEEETRKKDNWVKGDKGLFAGSVPYASRVKLAKGEYQKITSEISTNYSKYAGKEICYHLSAWRDKYYTYEFINKGFGDYLFTDKRED